MVTITQLENEVQKVIDKDYDHEQPDIPRGKEFNKVYRKVIKKLITPYGLELLKQKSSAYCECSGFITDNKGHFIYFNSGDYRSGYGRTNKEWKNNILIRTAKNAQDHTGGYNYFTSLASFGTDVFKIISK